jgi:hypothetical protein
MGQQHCLNGIPFTCSNRYFETDVNQGKPHGPNAALGSVFDQPLINNGGLTLWLEYVKDKHPGPDVFWLMWYDVNGWPTIPLSGVFDRTQLQDMVSRLAKHITI